MLASKGWVEASLGAGIKKQDETDTKHFFLQ